MLLDNENPIKELLEIYSIEDILLMIKNESLLFWLENKSYSYQSQKIRDFLKRKDIIDADIIIFFF